MDDVNEVAPVVWRGMHGPLAARIIIISPRGRLIEGLAIEINFHARGWARVDADLADEILRLAIVNQAIRLRRAEQEIEVLKLAVLARGGANHEP